MNWLLIPLAVTAAAVCWEVFWRPAMRSNRRAEEIIAKIEAARRLREDRGAVGYPAASGYAPSQGEPERHPDNDVVSAIWVADYTGARLLPTTRVVSRNGVVMYAHPGFDEIAVYCLLAEIDQLGGWGEEVEV